MAALYPIDLKSPQFLGIPTAPTATAGTSTTQLATTAFVTASPQFTGTPIAPTAAAGTNTTQIATTAFVATAVPTASFQTISGASGTVTGGVIIATNGAGSTFTLPASPVTGQQLWIVAGVTLTGPVISASSNVIPLNSTTAGTSIIATSGSFAHLVYNGTSWQVVNGK